MSKYIDKINQLSADIHFKLEGSTLSSIYTNYGVNTEPYTFAYYDDTHPYLSVTGISGNAIRSVMDDKDNYISNTWVSTDDGTAFLTSPFEKTINVWAKIDDIDQFGGSMPIINKFGSSTSAALLLQKRPSDDTYVIRIQADNGTTQLYPSGIAASLNEWQMITVVIPANGAGNYVKFYLNGSYVSQVAMNQTYGSTTLNGPTAMFGSLGGLFGSAGQFDEFSIFNYNLSDSEIASIYDAAFSTYNSPTALTATAEMPNPVVYVTPNYYSKVKSKNPVFYIFNGETTPANIINNGSDYWGTAVVGSGIQKEASNTPFNLIAEGSSWGTASTYNATNSKLGYGNSNAWNSLKPLFSSFNFSVEFWINPSNTFSTSTSTARTFFNLSGTGGNAFGLTRSALPSGGDVNAYYSLQLTDNGTTQFLNTAAIPSPTINKWHQIVASISPNTSDSTKFDMKLYVDQVLVGSATKTKGSWSTLSSSIYADISFSMTYTGGSQWDELAIYPTALTASQIIDNYSFVAGLSPDRQTYAYPMVASGQMTDAVIAVTIDKNLAGGPMTATSLMVDPTIGSQINRNISATPITATALMVEPAFFGVPDRSIHATPLTAQADFPSATKKNTAYSDFIKNLSPYRYHSLDNINDWVLGYPRNNTNEGSDTSYTLTMFDVGLGTHSLAQDVINNYSVHSEMNYQTNNYQRSLVIKESVYNDMWGTDLPTNGTGWTMGFWMKQHESFTYQNGLIVLANINGSSTGDHIVVYYDVDRIFVELNDGGTKATYETSPVTLFNGLKHNIVMTFRKVQSNTHELNIYVDGAKKLTADTGALHPQIIPSTTVSSPNSTNYNIVSLGGMITNYSNTFFNTVPQNLNAYFDEFFWFKSSLTATQIANQYNALPGTTPVAVIAEPMTASALEVAPTTRLGVGISQTALTSTALMVNPTLIVDFDHNVNIDPFLASAEMRVGSVTNDKILIVEDVMFASATLPQPIIAVTIPGGTMTATAKIVNPDRVNSLPITEFNSYLRYLRAESLNHQISHYREVV